jgi:spermidine synthase
MTEPTWFEERVAPGVRIGYQANRILYQARSSAHEKAFIDTTQFGRVLMLDGAIQVTGADEFIYHEMMSHVPIFAHGAIEDALIIGGGDCGLAEEVLKHSRIKELTQVEIDPQVVSLARSYFASINAPVFRDDRFRLQIGDGAEFVASTEQRFDLILVDCTDPGPLSSPIFTHKFFRAARGCLKPGGVLVAQVGVPFLQPLPFAATMRHVAAVFPQFSCFLASVPSIYGGPIAFAWGSSSLKPDAVSLEELTARFNAANIDTRCYTPKVHQASFVLPRFLDEALKAAGHPDSESSARDVSPHSSLRL